MADLTITAANILPDYSVAGLQPQIAGGTAGETLTQGLSIYKKASDSKYYKADNNDVTDSPVAEVATVAGVTLNSTLAGQPISFQTGGLLAFGAILTKGTDYILSSTVGAIAPIADYGSGKYNSKIGIGYSTTQMLIQIQNSGLKSA